MYLSSDYHLVTLILLLVHLGEFVNILKAQLYCCIFYIWIAVKSGWIDLMLLSSLIVMEFEQI